MSIKHWSSSERPREKLIRFGVSTLSDAELVAIILRSGLRGMNVVEVARQALQHFGGLSEMLRASRSEFCRLPGLGDAGYSQLHAAIEISNRHAFNAMERGDALSSPGKVRRYLSLQLSGVQHEIFAALFLDNRHRVIVFEELFNGTIDGAAVYPREVMKRCLAANAAAVIFAHNHPSGVAEPSDADISITRKLSDALALIDVRVLDHLIIGQGVQTSLAERGLM